MINNRVRRRTALKASLGVAAAGVWIAPEIRAAESRSANERLNIACIGIGGQGAANLAGVKGQNLVALCDVDDQRAGKAYVEHPKAAKFYDFRVMFDKMEQEIDAVVVSTPDHTHAAITMAVLRAIGVSRVHVVQQILAEGLAGFAEGAWWLDVSAGIAENFLKRMKMYRLRAKAEIEEGPKGDRIVVSEIPYATTERILRLELTKVRHLREFRGEPAQEPEFAAVAARHAQCNDYAESEGAAEEGCRLRAPLTGAQRKMRGDDLDRVPFDVDADPQRAVLLRDEPVDGHGRAGQRQPGRRRRPVPPHPTTQRRHGTGPPPRTG